MGTSFKTALAAAALALAVMASPAFSQGKIIVVNGNLPGVGFNDTTPAAPIGGNTGTTLGQQRMNVYRYVADIWQKAITSDVTITVNAGWEALTCTSTSAVLGSASAWNIWYGFPSGVANT